jgi:hypothetical protein
MQGAVDTEIPNKHTDTRRPSPYTHNIFKGRKTWKSCSLWEQKNIILK